MGPEGMREGGHAAILKKGRATKLKGLRRCLTTQHSPDAVSNDPHSTGNGARDKSAVVRTLALDPIPGSSGVALRLRDICFLSGGFKSRT